MVKSIQARATFSDKARAMFADPKRRLEIIRRILAGFRKHAPADTPADGGEGKANG